MKTFFRNEADFQRWVTEDLKAFGHHPQPITGDDKYPGIPDVSVGMYGGELWAELKCWRTEWPIHTKISDVLKKERKTTAQQVEWLKTRAARGGGWCGVLIAWRSGHGAHYISFVPHNAIDEVMGTWTLSALALSDYTDTLEMGQKWRLDKFLLKFKPSAGSAVRP